MSLAIVAAGLGLAIYLLMDRKTVVRTGATYVCTGWEKLEDIAEAYGVDAQSLGLINNYDPMPLSPLPAGTKIQVPVAQ